MFDFVNIFMFLGLLLLLMERVSEERTLSSETLSQSSRLQSQILSKIEGQS